MCSNEFIHTVLSNVNKQCREVCFDGKRVVRGTASNWDGDAPIKIHMGPLIFAIQQGLVFTPFKEACFTSIATSCSSMILHHLAALPHLECLATQTSQ